MGGFLVCQGSSIVLIQKLPEVFGVRKDDLYIFQYDFFQDSVGD